MNRPRVIAFLPTYNEHEKSIGVLERFTPELVDEVIVVDDGSNDGSSDLIQHVIDRSVVPMKMLRHSANRGVGAAIRTGIDYAREQNFDIFVVLAGNGKDDPQQIPRLLAPIVAGTHDYVQGSRFLEGGAFDNLPLGRKILIKTYTRLLSMLTGFHHTDATNGFRAYRLSIFDNPQIQIHQDWLDRYELETYLQYQILRLPYRVTEVPVSKLYPKRTPTQTSNNYSKIRPFIDWWKIFRPLVFLKLRLKK